MINQSDIFSKSEWNALIKNLPGFSVLQTWELGAVKSKYGWKPERYIWRDEFGKVNAAALILVREKTIPILNMSFLTIYIPQGPLLDWSNISLRGKVLDDIREFAQGMDVLSTVKPSSCL